TCEMATRKMMNGTGLMMLITMFNRLKRNLFSRILFWRVTNRRSPMMMPRMDPKMSVAMTMVIVWPVASTMRGQKEVQSTFNFLHLLDVCQRCNFLDGGFDVRRIAEERDNQIAEQPLLKLPDGSVHDVERNPVF